MLKNLLNKLQASILGGAIIIGAASIASRLIGLVRDRMLASTFGAGDVLDTYYAAFRLPDFIFNILVLGALSSSFIPIFLQYWHSQDGDRRAEAWRITNTVLNLLLVTLVGFSIVAFLLAPWLMHWLVPGFSAEKREATTLLTRIMLGSIIFFGVSNVLSGLLNSFRRFLAFSLAPIMYNVGIIFGIYVLVPRWGSAGLAIGVVLGAATHMLVQLPTAWRLGWRYRWHIDFNHPGVKKIWRLMIPRTLGLAVVQINQMITNVIASTLAVGSVAVFNLADNLQSFPINVFGVSLAVSAFPVFSRAFAEQDTVGFVGHFSESFRRILYLIIPASIAILLLRAQIVRLILGTGNFNWTDTVLTAQTLGIFAVSLFSESLIPLMARSFYAFHDTKTPVLISGIAVALNVSLGFWLSRSFGIIGLVSGFAIASILNMMLLLATLRVRFGDLDDIKIIRSTVKIIFGSIVLGGVIQIMKYAIAPMVDMHTFFGVLIQTVVALVAGGLAYLLITMAMKSDEIGLMVGWIDRAKRLFRNPTQS